jgi:hypothetical protein
VQHPNALAALLTTAISAGLLALAHRFTDLHLSSVEAMTVSGAITTAVLFVGRRGIGPTLSAIWHGAKQGAVGPPPGAAP